MDNIRTNFCPSCKELADEMAEQCRIIGMSAERELTLRAEIERLREALQTIVDRPGCGIEYIPGHGDEFCSEARHMELIASAALAGKA